MNWKCAVFWPTMCVCIRCKFVLTQTNCRENGMWKECIFQLSIWWNQISITMHMSQVQTPWCSTCRKEWYNGKSAGLRFNCRTMRWSRSPWLRWYCLVPPGRHWCNGISCCAAWGTGTAWLLPHIVQVCYNTSYRCIITTHTREQGVVIA